MGYTMDGNMIAEIDVPCTIGESHSVAYPAVEFFTCIGGNDEEGTVITPAEDTVVEVFYFVLNLVLLFLGIILHLLWVISQTSLWLCQI